MTTEKRWNVYQTAIFRDVAEGEGHTVVQARAGTGKTTTIVEAFSHVPKGLSVLMVAFNKKIAEELQRRAPAGVHVSTLHSYGFSAIRSAFGSKVRVDNAKVPAMVRALVGDRRELAEYRTALAKVVGLAKGTLADTDDAILDLVDAYDIDLADADRKNVCADAFTILAKCKAAPVASIDFDDMVWLPVVLGLRVQRFDRVFVDETQDLNASQIKLALAACKDGGRICAVGDDRQAIYGFRGADADAMARVIEGLSAKVLPLSVTYRCASSIVDLAKNIVADYEAAPNAPYGIVDGASLETMKKNARPGDFILSRANAPLVGLCLAFLLKGVPATVAGRDVGAGLVALIDKSRAATVADLTAWVEEWLAAEQARLEKKKGADALIEAAQDKAACLHALCEGTRSVAEVRAKIETLFSDTDDARRVVLSTTHKAKGLERDRAWILSSTYKPTRSREEANLYYVAVTRAKAELYLVSDA